MSLADVMQPAIRHAARGFVVTPYLSDCIQSAGPDLLKDKLAARRLLPDGTQLKAGERLVQGDYAEALTLIAEQGEGALHGGPLGDRLVECMEKNGGFVSAKDLAEEGWQQRNCVAAYASRVRRGCCYIYRVLAPERATLALFLRKDGWRLGELEARSNRDVSQDTELLVKAWLAQSTPRKVTSPTSGTSCRTRRPSNEWSAPTEAQAA